MSRKTAKLISIGRLLALALAFIVLAAIPPELVEQGPTLCLFRSFLGIKCLGCGMTRALSSLLHGDLQTAMAFNNLVVIVFPLLCVVLLADLVSGFHFTRRRPPIPAKKNFQACKSFAMDGGELRASLLIAWLIVSLCALLALCAPFILSAETIAGFTPVCEWKAKYNRDCPLCGMTTSFILISQGSFKEALANRASLAVYGAFVLNECVASFFLVVKLRRIWSSEPREKSGAALKRTEELSAREGGTYANS